MSPLCIFYYLDFQLHSYIKIQQYSGIKNFGMNQATQSLRTICLLSLQRIDKVRNLGPTKWHNIVCIWKISFSLLCDFLVSVHVRFSFSIYVSIGTMYLVDNHCWESVSFIVWETIIMYEILLIFLSLIFHDFHF